MAEKLSPAEAKKQVEATQLAIKEDATLDEAARAQKLDELFQNTASSLRKSLSVLTIPDRSPANAGYDNLLTEAEVVRSIALVKAYDAASKASDDTSIVLDKTEKLLDKYKKDKGILKDAKTKFEKLKTDYPDSSPENETIDISEVAQQDLDFLTKTFPEQMKKANDDLQKQNVYGTNLNPIETLGKITDLVAPIIKR